MSYGINIYNNFNKIQISQDLETAVLVMSGTVGPTAAPQNSNAGTVTFPRTLNKPIVFMRADIGQGFVMYGMNTEYFKYGTFGGSGNVEYRVYETGAIVSPDTSGYGMQVFNAAGNVTFETSKRTPLINQNIVIYPSYSTTISAGWHDNTTVTMRGEDGGQPWISAPPLHHRLILQSRSYTQVLSTFARFSTATNLQIQEVPIFTFGSPYVPPSPRGVGIFPRKLYITR